MTVYVSDPAVLDAYAERQYLSGMQMARQHRGADAAGCCVHCGERAPCAAVVHGVQLCQVYAEWAPGLRGIDTTEIPRGVLIRPYVLPRNRRGDRAAQ